MLAGGPQQYILFFQALTIFIAESFLAPRVSAAELTIPCNAQHFTFISYNDYTIRDCTRSDGSPFLFLGTRPDASALIDVSITVLNGAVIPQLFSNTTTRLENVSVLISGAQVGPYHRVIAVPTETPSLSIMTVYNAAATIESFLAKNISMKVHNTTVLINTSTPVYDRTFRIHGNFLLSLPLVGPAEVHGLRVNVTECDCHALRWAPTVPELRDCGG
ncbi:Hypothetical protein, putative [Bodo saltans]|uniref:Membrane-associated protein n=1 Tax=Bodo saltans TaxID=75058 RepID=A0A0S4J4V0_BODSA|nr:Hypothetical protein, putative [Bodo saltans]|eukprot:CUG78780.1 Hypothetical protein, putative [Bodo saltans]